MVLFPCWATLCSPSKLRHQDNLDLMEDICFLLYFYSRQRPRKAGWRTVCKHFLFLFFSFVYSNLSFFIYKNEEVNHFFGSAYTSFLCGFFASKIGFRADDWLTDRQQNRFSPFLPLPLPLLLFLCPVIHPGAFHPFSLSIIIFPSYASFCKPYRLISTHQRLPDM